MDKQLSEVIKAADCIHSALSHANIEQLSAETFRVFIHSCNRGLTIPPEVLKEVSTNILSVLASGCLVKDSQIVAATGYCSVETYLHQESAGLFDHFLNTLNNTEYNKFNLYLCNGIAHLNTKHFTENITGPPKSRDDMIRKILKIVESECSKLNSTTYLAFDTFNEILSIILETRGCDYPISPKCLKPLLHIVTSNFENPMPGVRQKNLQILEKLLCFYNETWLDVLPKLTITNEGSSGHCIEYQSLIELVVTYLPWTMKSKYFILKVIIRNSAGKVLQKYGEQIVQGLLLSLSSPHLVSAGADLYKQLLSISLTEWIDLFFIPLSRLMCEPGVSLVLENIFNHWFEYTFSVLHLHDLLDYLLCEVHSINLYSYISLLRISRKEGIDSLSWGIVDQQRLKYALENVSDKIRSQAFSFICTKKKTSELPTKEEFKIVHQFLKHNINSDNTAFRHSLLNSFTNFIVRIRDSILFIQKQDKLELDVSLKYCFSFFDWLNSFLIFNLEGKCNYQRKITSLELYTIILTYFGDPVDGMIYARKSNKKHLSLKNIKNSSWLYKFESEVYQKTLLNSLFDEDSDIRDCSANIILKHFARSNFLKAEDFECLYQKGTTLCSSQIFYKAESGAIIINILVTLAHNPSSVSLKDVHDKGRPFLDELLSTAEQQFHNIQEDLLKAASKGSFLYGTLLAIRLLWSGNGPDTLNLFSNMDRLLLFLEEVVDFFISALSPKSNCDLDCAPSFGEMGEAISTLVEMSSVKVSKEKDDDEGILASESGDLHLTPAQQLVLNCIWLNLKESSMLCYELVKRKGLSDYLFTERCVLLVVSILRRCRHKGVIEASGVAFSKIIDFLTKNIQTTSTNPQKDCNSHCSHLPVKLLDMFLKTIFHSSKTVSRRSAGLAIMVHKLIAADARKSKPLLHHCVTSLLALAKQDSPACASTLVVDLPQGQAMHLLRALVQDSSLKQSLLPYYTDICMVSLANMASSIWTIRNAALQLFGAFVPKLVGQKPQQEEGVGSQYLLFEQLYAHAKPVVDMLLNEFSFAVKSNSTIFHAKLMPILTLVTNVSVGLEKVLVEDVSKTVINFQECFQKLFESRIFNVRKLSAKAHAQFLSFPEIIPTIIQRVHEIASFLTDKKCLIKSENGLHGNLLNVTYLVRKYDEEKVGMKRSVEEEKKLNESISSLSKVLLLGQHCYFIKALVFKWKRATLVNFDIAETYRNTAEKQIGFSYFVDKQIAWTVVNLKGQELEEYVKLCLLQYPLYDTQLSCVNALNVLFKSKCELKSTCDPFYITIFVILKNFVLECSYIELISLTIEVMFYIIETISINSSLIDSMLFCDKFILYSEENLKSDKASSSALTFLLPVVCGMLSSFKPNDMVDFELVQKVAFLINARCDSDFDQDIRFYAVKAMTLLAPVFKASKIKGTLVGELVWNACVDFLQDEVSEIRHEASRFIFNYFEEINHIMNPFYSLEYMFMFTSITELLFPEKAVECLWLRMLGGFHEQISLDGIKNPFDHGGKNIFIEESVLSNLAYHCLLVFANSQDINSKAKLKKCCNHFTHKENDHFLTNYVQDIERCLNVDTVSKN